jgi:hypothetical protein
MYVWREPLVSQPKTDEIEETEIRDGVVFMWNHGSKTILLNKPYELPEGQILVPIQVNVCRLYDAGFGRMTWGNWSKNMAEWNQLWPNNLWDTNPYVFYLIGKLVSEIENEKRVFKNSFKKHFRETFFDK